MHTLRQKSYSVLPLICQEGAQEVPAQPREAGPNRECL